MPYRSVDMSVHPNLHSLASVIEVHVLALATCAQKSQTFTSFITAMQQGRVCYFLPAAELACGVYMFFSTHLRHVCMHSPCIRHVQ
jgi:hypothetical protein